MTPEEVIHALRPYGQHIARSTLTQYARAGVIGSPTVRSLGRGRGRVSEYPPQTPAEVVAARTLVGTTLYPSTITWRGKTVSFKLNQRRITLEVLAAVRRLAYTTTAGKVVDALERWDEGDKELLRELVGSEGAADPFWLLQVLGEWLARRAWVLHKLPEPPARRFGELLFSADPDTRLVSLYDP